MNNPIIQRELLSFLRQPRAAAMQFAFAAALCLLVISVWPDSAQVNLDGQQARQLFSVFVYGLFAGLVLLAPAMPAISVVRERQQRTLTLLLTSPLTPLQIALGKIVSSLGFIGLLLALSLPAAAACFAMGGISAAKLTNAYLLLSLIAVQYAMLGLAVSAQVKTTDAALRTTYALVLLLSVIAIGPNLLFQGRDAGELAPLATAAEYLAALSPIPAVTSLLGQGDIASRGLQTATSPITRYAIAAAVTIVFCALWLLRNLRSTATDRARSKGNITNEQQLRTRLLRRILYLVDPQRRTRPIAFWQNPVMVKEFRTRTFGRANWMFRLIGICLVTSLLIMIIAVAGALAMDMDMGYMGGVLVIFQIGLIVLLTPALSAAIISGEVETGGWVLLHMTPMSARRIVTGKLLSVAWTLALILGSTLPGYIIMLVIDTGEIERVINVLISLLLTAIFALSIGAACSASFKRTATATAAAYLILISLCVLTLLPWLAEGTLFGRSAVEATLIFNPLAAALSAMRMPGMAEYSNALIPTNWYMLAAATVLCLLILWHRTRQLTKPQ